MYPLLRFVKEMIKFRNAPPLGPLEAHVSTHICWPWDLDSSPARDTFGGPRRRVSLPPPFPLVTPTSFFPQPGRSWAWQAAW